MSAVPTAERSAQRQLLCAGDLPDEAPQARPLSARLALLFAQDLMMEDAVGGGDDGVFVFCPRALSGSPGVG